MNEIAELKRIIASCLLSTCCYILKVYAPIAHLLFSAGVLSIIDIGLGIYRAKVIRKERISAAKFFKKFKVFGLFWGLISCSILAGPAFVEFGYPYYSAAIYASGLFIFYELLGIVNKLADLGLPVATVLSSWLGKKVNIDNIENR